MAKLIGFEIRRYATIRVDDDMDIPSFIESAVAQDDDRIDWNEPEVDYIETLCEEESDDISDIAYEERRDACLC